MRLVWIGIMFLCCPFIYAQNVKGKVVESSDGEPLVGATVYLPGQQNGTVTDRNGSFELTVPNQGSYRAKVSFVGYKSQQVQLTTDTFQEIQLEVNRLEEVIIESVRADKDDPVAQATVQKAEIEKIYIGQDPTFIMEDLTPSVVAYSESGTRVNNYSTMRLRGIEMKRINFTLNGVPLNDMIDQGVFFSNFPGFGNSLQSVQVQRGVGTSANGAASYAGSVNFESVNLETPRKAEVQAGAGSFNSYRGSLELNTGKLENNTAFYSRFSRINSDGFRENSFTNAYSFFFSGAYFMEKDLFKVNGFTARSRNGLAYSASPVDAIQENRRHNPLNENDTDDFGQQLLQFQHVHTFNEDFSINSSLYYGGAGGDFFFHYQDGDGNLTGINFPLYNDHYGIMSNISWANKNLTLDGGVHAYLFQRTNLEQIVPDYANPYYEENSEKEELSTFAKATYQQGDLQLFADVQVRTMTLRVMPDYSILSAPASNGNLIWDWTFLNPTVGASYQVDLTQQLYASFGRSNREPRKVDLFGAFSLTDANYDQVRNSNFLPESVNDFEAGYRYSGDLIRANLNVFYMQFTNEITESGQVIEFGSQLRRNIPSSRRYGAELQAEYEITDYLKLNTNLTFMESKIDPFVLGGQELTGKSQPYAPHWIGNGDLTFSPYPWSRITLSGRFVSEQFVDLQNQSQYTIPGFAVFNGQVTVGDFDRFEFRVDVNNLTNESYYTFGNLLDTDFDGTPETMSYFVNAPINIFGTLILRL